MKKVNDFNYQNLDVQQPKAVDFKDMIIHPCYPCNIQSNQSLGIHSSPSLKKSI